MVPSRPVKPYLFNEAMAAYEREEFTTAYKLIRSLALGGDPKAQCLLGFMYYQGEGTQKSLHKAYKWLNRSALKGFSEAAGVRDLVGDLILKTGSAVDIANMKHIFKKSKIDRRSGADRRKADNPDYATQGGVERRSSERRKALERRLSQRLEFGY